MSNLSPLAANHDFSSFFSKKPNTGQVHVGRTADGQPIWHTGSDFRLWSGNHSRRTPGELHAECKTIIADLEALYPSLAESPAENRRTND